MMSPEMDPMEAQEPQEEGDESARLSDLEARVAACEAKLGIGAAAPPKLQASQMIGASKKGGGFYGDE